ncbi:MAG TPA: DUF177 domain-containing protein [Gemmatimonadaceae bacterium]|nr:DUF177 domain-containing protein [Gemmatimonadaceae bacterium]
MLSFDTRSLEEKAVQVDGQLASDDPVWKEEDPRPVEPVQVTGRLSTAGPGRYYFSGRIEGTAAAECRRCLTELRASVDEDVQLIFVEPGTEDADDPDMFPVDERTGEVDLRPAVREHWLLSVPGYALCREDCQGFCPTCGTDRNNGSCDCAPTSTDPRWDALRNHGRSAD